MSRRSNAASGNSILLEAGAKTTLGRLYAMRGEIDRGRVLHTEARDTYRAAGMARERRQPRPARSWIEERSGDLDAWERVVRRR